MASSSFFSSFSLAGLSSAFASPDDSAGAAAGAATVVAAFFKASSIFTSLNADTNALTLTSSGFTPVDVITFFTVSSSIFCSWRLLSGYFFFELNGSEGYINVDGRFDTHGGDKIFWSTKKDGKFYSEDFSHIKPNSYQLEIDNFVNNLKNGKPCSPNANDALEVMRMIKFIYENN